ncbi:T9SS type A sorting domain-containing protein [Polaribacter sp. L3A8]|uniref:T9SS type A sorting domain-containing protein n=1 Tax=Polaribacter sp. L3A8 TaxID=2686361 RepID=UPI00131C9458|nr:T9SS type A sorting domain-containing protein [Polaribacter sp. L3A8]
MKRTTTLKWLTLLLVLNMINIYAIDKKEVKGLTNPAKTTTTTTTTTTIFAPNDISTLPKNQIVPLVNDGVNFSGVTASTSSSTLSSNFSNIGNAIDSDLGNSSVGSVVLGGNSNLTITSLVDIPSGSYAGFNIDSGISLLSTITVTLYDGATQVDSFTPSSDLLTSIIGLGSGGKNIGFIAPAKFNKIRIRLSGVAASLIVNYPFVKIYKEETTTLTCNEEKVIAGPDYPMEIDEIGVTGLNLSLGDVVANADYTIDLDQSNHATLNAGAIGISVAATSFLSVKKQPDFGTGVVTPFAAGTYAGFNVTLANLLDVGVLDNIIITTYLNDGIRETSVGNTNLINAPLLGAASQNRGFITTLSYDEIRITVSKPAGVTLGEVQVNYPIIKEYCSAAALTCNEEVIWTNATYPVEVYTPASTGLISAGGSVTNLNNIINADTTDYAELALNVSAASSLEIGVYDVIGSYVSTVEAPYNVGFEIENTSLLEVDLLNSLTISTYLNGSEVQSKTGANVVVGAPILAFEDRQTIGFLATSEFDEVRIKFNTTVGVNLGTLKIYNSIIKKMCSTTLECNTTYALTTPTFSTYVDFQQTGVSGLACVGCTVSNTGNVLSSDDTDYATINVTAGVAAKVSLAVRDATNTYPAGSYAGFALSFDDALVSLEVLRNSITITTLDANGDVLESKSASNLIGLELLTNIIGTSATGDVNLGFKTTQAYSGIKISASSLVSVAIDNEIDVYGAFVDTRGATGGSFGSCLVDSDNDGIDDSLDIDDDNDGIIDIIENGNCAIEDKVEIVELYSEDFGSGTGRSSNPYVENHLYDTNGAIPDGSYAIVSSNSPGLPAYNRTDQNGNVDANIDEFTGPASGSTNGRYLSINMVNTGNIEFYRHRLNNLIIGADYRFRLDMAGLCNGCADAPIFRLEVQNSSGATLQTVSSSSLGVTNNDTWVRVNLNFTGTTDKVDIVIFNDQPNGGAGNDVGVDNIVFSVLQCPASFNDPDNDGLENSIDLDSDGDGCPDVREAGVPGILKTTNVTNGNGTDATANTTVATDDAILDIDSSGQSVGLNGLVASIETDDTARAITTYPSNYITYSLDKNINACGTAMITQVYQTPTERWIEITNATDYIVGENTTNLALFKDGASTSLAPSAFINNLSAIAPHTSILISSKTVNNKLAGVTEITGTDNANAAAVTDFSTANDIIVLTKNIDSRAWVNRVDVISSIADSTSYVRSDMILEPNTTFDSTEWVAFINDNIITYNDLEFDELDEADERHPHDPLLSEIVSANVNANIKPGLHNFGFTDRVSGDWSNGYPDRSREVKVSESYNHLEKLSARKLDVKSGAIFSITDHLLVVTNDVILNGEIRLVSTDDTNKAQMVQTHKGVKQVTGTGKLLVDQKSKAPNMYRYNYMGSPVNTIGESTYSVLSVLKDGTNPLTANGTIGQGASDIAKDITFVQGYNGSNTAPISIADYWIYTYGSAAGGRSNWEHKYRRATIAQTDGFIFKGPSDPEQNYTFAGTPKDGDLATAVGADQSYLVGNPFAGAMSAKKFIQDNTNAITGSLYFWEHAGEKNAEGTKGHYYGGYVGGYAIRNISMGLSANQVMSNNGADVVTSLVEAETETKNNGASDYSLDGISGVVLGSLNESVSFTSTIAADSLFINYKTISTGSIGVKVNGTLHSVPLSISSGQYTDVCLSKDIKVNDVIEVIYTNNSGAYNLYLDSFILKGRAVTDGAPAVGTGEYKVPKAYIAMGQGFFILGDADGGPIMFNNSQREYKKEGPESILFKSDNKSTEKTRTSVGKLPIIKLGMNYTNEEGLGLHRQIGISFKKENSFGYDNGYDSGMLDVGETDFYWKLPNSDDKYAIAGVQSISDDLEVPLFISLAHKGTVVIGVDEWDAIDRNVYIKDKLTKQAYLINNGSFSLKLASGSYTDRFFLAFKESNTLSVSDNTTVLNKNITVYLDSNTQEIVINNENNLQLKNVKLYNLLGQEIGKWNNLDQIATQQRLKTNKLSNAIYIINIETEKGKISKKVILE